MTTDRETTRIVRSWLEEGVTALPDRVLDNVLDQLPATPQRRAPIRVPWRIPVMNTPLKLALSAAAVVVALVLGINLMPGPQVAAPDEPTPSPSPSPTPRSFAEATGALEPGRYVFDGDFPIRFSFEVPAGWQDPGVNRTGGGLVTPEAGSDREVLLSFWDARNVYADACDPASELDPGPTVDDFADALAKVESADVTGPTPVSIDGIEGKHLEITRSVECPADYRLWTVDSTVVRRADVGQGDPPTDEVWIVEVEGTRLVIDLISSPNASAEDVAEGRAMVDSIDFEESPGS